MSNGIERKYFTSYVAYAKYGNDFFNDIVYIDEEITTALIERIQESLLAKLNDGIQKSNNRYCATQIIGITLINN